MADLNAALAAMRPLLDPAIYVFATANALPSDVDAFAVIREPSAMTLVVREGEARRLGLVTEFVCRRIDPGVDTPLDGVGFLARIAGALAAAGIALNPVAGAKRDHLFVPKERADDALAIVTCVAREARHRAGDASLWEFAPDVWLADGETVPFFTMAYPTRMTVVRLPTSELWVHSPIRHTEALAKALEALGTVSYLVAPNALHHLFMAAWVKAYPNARCFTAPGVAAKLPDITTEPLDDRTPWREVIDQITFEGSPLMQEVVFLHKPSRTLIVTDLIENFDPNTLSWKDRMLARIGGVLAPHGGTPRDWRWSFFGRGLEKASACARTIRDWAPERLVLAHGEPIYGGAGPYIDQALGYFLRERP